MTKKEENYNTFLTLLGSEDVDYVEKVKAFMDDNNYAYKAEHRKIISLVSFTNKKTKKVVASFSIKGGTLSAKIIGDNVNSYEKFLDQLPMAMIESIKRSPECKQRIDSSACWQACEMGSVFQLNETELSKCRYHCFSFELEEGNKKSVFDFIQQELKYQV